MENSFIELAKKELEINISHNQILNLFEMHDLSNTYEININVDSNVSLIINLTLINYKANHKIINLNINLNGSDSVIEANANCLGLDKSKTNIAVNAICHQPYYNKINTSIYGIIDSQTATIIGQPQLIFNTNSVEAKHALVIGTVNQTELNYLLSRGINYKEAKYMLVANRLFSTINNLEQNKLEQTKKEIMQLWGNYHA